jgi:hypothetical protein
MAQQAIMQYPKWIVVHSSHVVTKASDSAKANISVTHNFWPWSVDRVTGTVTVLVQNAAEETRALAAAS